MKRNRHCMFTIALTLLMTLMAIVLDEGLPIAIIRSAKAAQDYNLMPLNATNGICHFASSFAGQDVSTAFDKQADKVSLNQSETSTLFSEIPSQYIFTSGSGAWSTKLTVNRDGSFSGSYLDTDMNGGADYEWTQYISEFSGQFVNPKQIDDYTWSFELGKLDYSTPLDQSEVVYNSNTDSYVMNCYTDAYGIEGGKTFCLYLPGTPAENLPEEFVDWARPLAAVKDSMLMVYSIYNLDQQHVFISYDEQGL